MIKYEVGQKFPHSNPAPGHENCRAQIVGSSFDVLYFMERPKSQDIRTFKDSLLRFHVYVEDHIPFITISYLGSAWTYDLTITTAGMEDETAKTFFSPGNAVTFFLVDAGIERKLLAGRLIGLHSEAEQLIKSACARQREIYGSPADVQRVINRVYRENTTDQLIAKSQRWEFRKS